MKISFNNTLRSTQILLPASKSISNRVLMIQSLCGVECTIKNLSEANDTILLKKLLAIAKIDDDEIIINVEDAGTACRFIISYLAIQQNKKYIVTGTERMLKRPIGDLVDALISLGASIEYLGEKGFLPLKIKGKNIEGGDVYIQTTISSQYVSSLCLIAPTLPLGMTIHTLGDVVSETYIDMTLSVMKNFGIEHSINNHTISIPSQKYIPQNSIIENDWSSACFFYCMILIKKDLSIFLPFLQKESIQGDAYISNISVWFGIESIQQKEGILLKKNNTVQSIPNRIDLTNYPDLAIPFIVFCAVAYPSISLSGLQHLEYKESKRLTALTTELLKIGVELHYQEDVLTFVQASDFGKIKAVSFFTYNDHRIAMALSMISILNIEVTIDDSECVQKSFPTFWNEIQKIGFEILA